MKLLHRQISFDPPNDQNTAQVYFSHKVEGFPEYKLFVEIVVNEDPDDNPNQADVSVFSRTENAWRVLAEMPMQEIKASYKHSDDDTDPDELQKMEDFVDDVQSLILLAGLILDAESE